MCAEVDVRYGTHDSSKPVKDGYSLITSKHLDKYSLKYNEANKISQIDFNKINERSQVHRFDILFSMIGTVGRISLVADKNIHFGIKNVGLFETSQKQYYTFYIHQYLKSASIKNYVDSRLAGSTQKYISLGALRQMPIMVFNDMVTPIYKKTMIT